MVVVNVIGSKKKEAGRTWDLRPQEFFEVRNITSSFHNTAGSGYWITPSIAHRCSLIESEIQQPKWVVQLGETPSCGLRFGLRKINNVRARSVDARSSKSLVHA
jgi:hypothetical protein